MMGEGGERSERVRVDIKKPPLYGGVFFVCLNTI
jgi:hypothetical protein